MKKIIYAAATVLALAACSKESNPTITGNETKEEGVLFYANLSEEIKTSLDSELKVLWSSTDAISVNGVKYVVLEGAGTTSAVFTKEDKSVADPEAPFTAIYPAGIVSEDGISFSATQGYAEDKNIAASPMYAYSEEENTLSFTNLCGLLKISVTGLPSGTKINEIRVSAKEAICGNAEIIKKNSAMQLAIKDDASKGNTIKMNFGAEGIDPAGKVFYFAIPAGTYTTLSVEARNSAELWSKSAPQKVKTEAAQGTGTVMEHGTSTITRNNVSRITLATAADANGVYPANLHHGIKVGDLYWADRNIGATKIVAETSGKSKTGTNVLNTAELDPAFGDYYSWGSDGLTKNRGYSNKDSLPWKNETWFKGTTPFAIPLSSGHDTAREIWGGSWRMATQGEFVNLYNRASRNNDNALNFIYTIDSIVLYFPKAGHYTSGTTYVYDQGGSKTPAGFYYSSTRTSTNDVYYMFKSSTGNDGTAQGFWYADSIRPVTE